MATTKKGKGWEIKHSLWIIWSFFIFANGIGLMLAGYKTRVKKWRNTGLFYIFATWIVVLVGPRCSGILKETMSIVLVGLLLACIIHSFVIRKEYLIRLELLIDQKSEQYMTDEIRDKVAREYGISSNTLNANDVVMQENKTSLYEKKAIITDEQIYDNKQLSNNEYVKSHESSVNKETNNNIVKTNQSDPSLLDINTCTQEDLLNLPGVGIIEVKKVLDFRNKNEFNSVEEFIEVVNMKPHFAEQIRPKLICNKVNSNLINENVSKENVSKENNKASHMGRMVDF